MSRLMLDEDEDAPVVKKVRVDIRCRGGDGLAKIQSLAFGATAPMQPRSSSIPSASAASPSSNADMLIATAPVEQQQEQGQEPPVSSPPPPPINIETETKSAVVQSSNTPVADKKKLFQPTLTSFFKKKPVS